MGDNLWARSPIWVRNRAILPPTKDPAAPVRGEVLKIYVTVVINIEEVVAFDVGY